MRPLKKTGTRRKRDKRRVLICKVGPREAIDQALMSCGRNARIGTVDSLGEAIASCLEGGVDTLIVNMFSFSAGELTALMMFREMRPRQEVVLLCGEDAVPMLSIPGLATACYPVATPPARMPRARRVRP